MLIDAAESRIERPKKRVRHYLGKKKRDTLKSQVVVDKKSKQVICTNFSNGKKHDFKLFKESRVRWRKETKALTDTGYTGIHKIQSTTRLPKKRQKGKPLTREEKQANRAIAVERVLNENVTRMSEAV